MSALLLSEGMTVTTCHIDTVDCAAHARRADVLVVAVGKAGLVTSEWVKPGAIVIDVGINFVPDASKKAGRRMAGDVDEGVRAVAGFLTPVPGGVGPMTVAMLMSNTVDAHTRRPLAVVGVEDRGGGHLALAPLQLGRQGAAGDDGGGEGRGRAVDSDLHVLPVIHGLLPAQCLVDAPLMPQAAHRD